MSEIPVFPFPAIVGQEKAKLALLCNAVNPSIGGVLLSGEKGCGKSTMVRALADVLPEIEVVKGCIFGCNPRNELEMCDECRKKAERGEIEVEFRKMKVVNLPLSISVDRLIGSIDIEKAFKGIKALSPGVLAEANRNILYIDEVNLLDDYIADLLLDCAAMGWNVVEREGISLKHPSKFVLVGSMNPEEGELRPQILDRFGLFVKVEVENSVEKRMEILSRVEEFNENPAKFRKKYRGEMEKIRERVVKAKELLNKVEIDEELTRYIVKTVIDFGIKTHRAEIVTLRTAKTIAALNGRRNVSLEDVNLAMELALPHRTGLNNINNSINSNISKQKNEESSKNFDRNFRNFDDYNSKSSRETASKESKDAFSKEMPNDVNDKTNFKTNKTNSNSNRGNSEKTQILSRDERKTIEEGKEDEKVVERAEYFRGSKGVRVSSTDGHGIHIYSVSGKNGEIDVFSSFKQALLKGKSEVDLEDLMIKVKKVRVPRLTAIVLDTSGSMLAKKRIDLALSIARGMVKTSYVKRDYLSLIVFSGERADLAVKPTKNYSKVIEKLSKMEVGGKTPLPLALRKLNESVKVFRNKNKKCSVRAILITDGKANYPPNRKKLVKYIKEELKKLKKADVKLKVYDTSKGYEPLSFINLLEEFAEVKKLS